MKGKEMTSRGMYVQLIEYLPLTEIPSEEALVVASLWVHIKGPCQNVGDERCQL
jgi:hypothetical protein